MILPRRPTDHAIKRASAQTHQSKLGLSLRPSSAITLYSCFRRDPSRHRRV